MRIVSVTVSLTIPAARQLGIPPRSSGDPLWIGIEPTTGAKLVERHSYPDSITVDVMGYRDDGQDAVVALARLAAL